MCYSLAGKSKTMLPGVAVATVSSIGFLGFLLGPPVIGFIAEMLNLRWSFALVAILGLTTTILASKIRNEKTAQT
jgi:MFS family permease